MTNSTGTYSRQTLKDIITTTLAYVDNDAEGEKAAWIKSIDEVLIHGDDKKHVLEYSGQQTEISGLFRLLKESLLTHRFQEVVRILLALLNDSSPNSSSEAISKVGMELLVKDRDTPSALQQFVSQIQRTAAINAKEVILNYALFLLSEGKTKEAKDQFQNTKLRDMMKFTQKSPRTEYVSVVFHLYQGVMWYVEWVTTKENLKKLQEKAKDGTLDEGLGVVTTEKNLLQSYAERATHEFNTIRDKPGIWDIFILKHVEILEFQDDNDEALKVLKGYASKNTDNPNTFWYLYEFYKRNEYDTKFQVENLRKFCDAVPSHEAAFTLHNHLIAQGESPASVIYLIFDLLDYVCWKDKVRPWRLLSQQLGIIADIWQSSACPEVVECWNCRVNWWPQFHFRLQQLAKDKSEEVEWRVYKAVVASYLLGSDNHYTQTVAAEEDLSEEDKQLITDASTKKLILC